MEIPEINMISNFEAGMNCLQHPSSISRFFSNSGIEKLPQVYTIRFLKWGALIFAIFATLSSLIKRLIKLILIYIHSVKPVIEQIIEFSEDDDVSLASSDDDLDDEEGEENCSSPTTSFRSQTRVDEDFSIKGWLIQGQNGQLRQRMRRSISGCWPEFNSGKNVVKLWDSLGFSLNFDEDIINRDSGNVVSTWYFDQDQKISEFPSGSWRMPPVVLTAEVNEKKNGVVLCGYDSRMPRGVPALFADWLSPAAEVGGLATGGVGKVYVRDEISGVTTVGDVRNVRVPLDRGNESDGETWWDAGAVIVGEEFDNAG